jgi:hypothetical protein
MYAFIYKLNGHILYSILLVKLVKGELWPVVERG